MQGPPLNRSVANVAWVRLFFNTSLMTKDEHLKFDSRCHVSDACAMEDMTLRGSSPHSSEATLEWKQTNPHSTKPVVAIVIAVICISLTSLLLLNAFLRRVP